MEISIIQAVLIGIIYYLGIIGTPWTTVLGSASLFQKPLVAGTIVGLILGKPAEGVIIGAAIQLPYIAFISAGGTVPVDPGLAGTLGTALAVAGGVDPAAAITLAVPLGLLGTIIWVVHMTVDVTFVHLADKAATQGRLKRICFLHVVPPQIFVFFLSVIPVALGAYFGAEYVGRFIAMMGDRPLHVLQVIGGILPALGIAMNLRSIGRPNTLLFYLLGFILSVYLKLDVIVIAVLSFIIAYFYTQFKEGKREEGGLL